MPALLPLTLAHTPFYGTGTVLQDWRGLLIEGHPQNTKKLYSNAQHRPNSVLVAVSALASWCNTIMPRNPPSYRYHPTHTLRSHLRPDADWRARHTDADKQRRRDGCGH